MGTPEFAVTTLKKLVDNDYDVVGVVTAPDRPAGRGQQIKESAVKKVAKAYGLPILQPNNLKNDSFLSALKALEANLQIVVAFRMLPEIVWKLPKFGTFNLHASLLPDYRGAAPINWVIINGESTTGVTTFFIDEKIDTGELILQEEVFISPDETAGELHDRLMEVGGELVLKTTELIANNKVSPQAQPQTKNLKTAHKLNKTNCKIDWLQPKEVIYNIIRGLNPYPSAWCYLVNGEETLTIKVHSVSLEDKEHDLENSQLLISKSEIKVAAKNGLINLIEIQLPGKRKMLVKDILNGYDFKLNSKMM